MLGLDHNPMLWTPRNRQVGDLTIIRVGDEFHMFWEQLPPMPDGSFKHRTGARTVGHAVSEDLFRWRTLPDAFACGPPGSYDAWSIFHMDVVVHKGTWYMLYTALDIEGAGQQQTIALTTSRDGVTWQKHPDNPVLRADPRYYEPRIPREATYQEKDFGRLWFRDPCVIRLDDGRFGMVLIARENKGHPDRRGCLAWAESDDLVRWTCKPPIYSPGRFHTIETPSIFAHGDRHYVIFMTHPGWCPHLVSRDPWQNAGDFYAVSESGLLGPYEAPADDVLVAAPQHTRLGAVRTVEAPDGVRLLYGWLRTFSAEDDDPQRIGQQQVVPPPKRVRFTTDGRMQVCYYEKIELFCTPAAMDNTLTAPMRSDGRAERLLPGEHDDFIFSARLNFERGRRAGLLLRCTDDGGGLQVMANRAAGRIELTRRADPTLLDARRWEPSDSVELKVVAMDYSLEVYADDRLMIHQVRYRERCGRLGCVVENAGVQPRKARLLTFTFPQPHHRAATPNGSATDVAGRAGG